MAWASTSPRASATPSALAFAWRRARAGAPATCPVEQPPGPQETRRTGRVPLLGRVRRSPGGGAEPCARRLLVLASAAAPRGPRPPRPRLGRGAAARAPLGLRHALLRDGGAHLRDAALARGGGRRPRRGARRSGLLRRRLGPPGSNPQRPRIGPRSTPSRLVIDPARPQTDSGAA